MADIKTTFRMIDMVSAPLRKMASAAGHTTEALNKISNTSGGMDKVKEDTEQASQKMSTLKGKIGGMVAAYAGIQGIKMTLGLTDELTSINARMDLMKDKQNTVAGLQDKIFKSAQRSRGAYIASADAVGKMGITAKDAFSNNNELIGFVEQVNKQFAIAGTSQEGQSAAMLQLTQAMGSGVLRGEELNSIFEQAPTIIQTIANYMGKPVGEIRNMAQEGKLTSKVVKSALIGAADETNKKFNSMPKTFGQIWTSIKNSALMKFKPILEKLNEVGNSKGFDRLIGSITTGLSILAGIATSVFDVILKVGDTIADNWAVIGPVVGGIVTAFSAYKGALVAMAAKTAIMTAAQGALNAVQLANPIGLIVAAIAVFIAAIVMLWKKHEGFRKAVTKMWNVVKDGFIVAWTTIGSFFTETIPAVFRATLNFFKSIPRFFVGLWNSVKDAFIGIWTSIASNPVVEGVVSIITSAFAKLKNGLTIIWTAIKTVAAATWKMIKAVVLGPVLLLVDLVTGNFGKLKADAAMIWNSIKQAAGMVWPAIKMVVVSAIKGVVQKGRSLWAGFLAAIKAIFNSIKQVIATIWSAIKGFVIRTVGKIKNGAVNGFKNMVAGIKKKISGIKEIVTGAFNGILDWIGRKVNSFKTLGSNIIEGLKEGISDAWVALKTKVKDVVDWIMGKFTFDFEINSPSRWMMRLGRYLMAGLGIGIDKGIPDVIRKTTEVTTVVKNGMPVEVSTPSVLSTGDSITAPLSPLRGTDDHRVTNNRFEINVTVQKESDENRLVNKLREMMNTGAEGVHI